MGNYFFILTTASGFLKTTLLLLAVAGLLGGCESATNTTVGTQATGSQYDKSVTLTGMVRDQDGPVKNAKLEVRDFANKTVVTSRLENSSRYSIEIPAGTTYPLLVTASPGPGTGESKKDALSVAVINPRLTKHDITPVSTAIAAKARARGGYTHENLTEAAMSTVAMPGKNKTEAGFRGDPTKQYGGWH